VRLALPFAGLFQRRSAPARNGAASWLRDEDRFKNYQQFLRAYRGESIRAPIGASSPIETRRLKHNFNKPICHLGADFLAAKPLKWKIDGDTDAGTLTTAAHGIWDRSGSDRVFLDAALSAGIYGDVVGLATQDEEGRPRVEFVAADIAFPAFSGSDNRKLEELDITWEEETREGRLLVRREFYNAAGREVFIDGEPVPEEAQSWERIPAVWIRNLALKGFPFGFSDLDGVAELVEEYDHICTKRTRIVDYYAAPNIVAEGMSPGDVEKSMGTIFYPPAGSKMYFLEWNGNQPDVEAQLTRLRNDIAEVSEVPPVAFGRQDSGFSSISGVALRILYGPLLSKTNRKRANWSPPLEYLMWLCLQAEGHAVELEAVNAVWQDPLPSDRKADAEAEKAIVDTGLSSVEGAMSRLGVEEPGAELEKVGRDRRFERLALLANAKDLGGVPPSELAVLAGFTPEEAAALEVPEPPPPPAPIVTVPAVVPPVPAQPAQQPTGMIPPGPQRR
jgi:hypothetical protein